MFDTKKIRMYQIPSASALVASASATMAASPAIKLWLVRQSVLDIPNERSSHSVPTPRGGGLACAVGAVVGAMVGNRAGVKVSASWVGCSSMLGLVGRIDDIAGLDPYFRLGAQVSAGLAAGSKCGGAGGALLGAASFPAIVNAFNFMDGINGISGGTAAAWGMCLATDSTLAPAVRLQGSIAAGMGLGFLPYNVPTASMFLGDVGSYLFGAGIAATVLEGSFSQGRLSLRAAVRVIAPIVPYLADTGTTIIRRAVRGDSVTAAHKEHAYQRLMQESGWPHWRVAGLVTLSSAACGVAARRSPGLYAIAPLACLYLLSPALVNRGSLRYGLSETLPPSCGT